MTLFSFIKVSLDKFSDLTSVKERSELLECKCVHLELMIPLYGFTKIHIQYSSKYVEKK